MTCADWFDWAVSQVAHFFVAGWAVYLFALKGWSYLFLPPAAAGGVSILLVAAVKEYLDRQGWWEPPQDTQGNVMDFLFYLLGVLVAGMVLLA